MAQTSWPFDGIDTTETQFSQWARNIGEGVKGSSSTTDLKVTAPGTGMTVNVAAGQAMVRGHYYASDASVALTVSTAHATLPRIDSVVLTLDPTANTILLAVVAGTPNASPAAPTLTKTDAGIYQLLLANIAVAAATSVISSGNVTDVRTFLGPSVVAANVINTNVSDKSANYTIAASDANSYIRSTSTAITVTVPDVLVDGQSVNFIQAGSGQVTFAGSGITLNSKDSLLKTAGQYAGASVTKVGGAYYLIGNLG